MERFLNKLDIKFLPWSNHIGALSFTFDDGDVSNITTAVPILNHYGVHATFFLVANQLSYINLWKSAFRNGHELGNHTFSHKLLLDLSCDELYHEIIDSHHKLSHTFETPVYSFAYPYTLATQEAINVVKQKHICARTGKLNNYIIKPNSLPDWYQLESAIAFSNTPFSQYKQWIDNAISKNSWLTLQFHALEGSESGYQPIPIALFVKLLEYATKSNIWIAPYNTVCAYWQAQQILQNSVQSVCYKGQEVALLQWKIPSFFPKGIMIQIKLNDSFRFLHLSQGGKEIAHKNGIYSISFDQSHLVIEVNNS